jgi:hypothetical protein
LNEPLSRSGMNPVNLMVPSWCYLVAVKRPRGVESMGCIAHWLSQASKGLRRPDMVPQLPCWQ